MQSEMDDYEIGKRHLANIMGADPDNFSQEEIDVRFTRSDTVHKYSV